MRTHVQKWGNSLAVRIPKSFAEEIGIDNESPVDISLHEGRLVIAPVKDSSYSLDQLLSEVTPDNVPGEAHAGPILGDEL
jgi:antitoxin MazE